MSVLSVVGRGNRYILKIYVYKISPLPTTDLTDSILPQIRMKSHHPLAIMASLKGHPTILIKQF